MGITSLLTTRKTVGILTPAFAYPNNKHNDTIYLDTFTFAWWQHDVAASAPLQREPTNCEANWRNYWHLSLQTFLNENRTGGLLYAL